MRFERKFRIENMNAEQVSALIAAHPLGFKTQFNDRWVNNIYLDTPELDALREKLNGIENRVKFRLRWYGLNYLEVKHPLLETKIKVGELGEKTHRPLPAFSIHSRQDILNFVSEKIPSPLLLQPVLLNRFLRSYLISASGEFRLTIDRKIEYRAIEPGFFSELNEAHDPSVIAEIKYEESLDDIWHQNSEVFPLNLTRSSKYVTGMILTGRGL